jgi:hypothetical protein
MNLNIILSRLETLLRQYDFVLEANTLNGIQKTLKINPELAYQQLLNKNWWVGENAVAEADLAIAGGFMASAREDQDRFQQLIIDLYFLLNEAGYENDYARIVTSQFNKWLVSRM